MTYVLIMAAFEFSYPVMFFILVKTHDAPIHGEPQTRGLTYQANRRAALTPAKLKAHAGPSG